MSGLQDAAWQQTETPDMTDWSIDDWERDAAELEFEMQMEWDAIADMQRWELACERRREDGLSFDDCPF